MGRAPGRGCSCTGTWQTGSVCSSRPLVASGTSRQLSHGMPAQKVVEHEPAELVLDTVAVSCPVGGRVVTIAAAAPGATYFVVEPDREQLIGLGTARRRA